MNWRNTPRHSNDATRDDIEKHIDRLTGEYMREAMGLPKEEIARINAEAEADVDRQIPTDIGAAIKAMKQDR